MNYRYSGLTKILIMESYEKINNNFYREIEGVKEENIFSIYSVKINLKNYNNIEIKFKNDKERVITFNKLLYDLVYFNKRIRDRKELLDITDELSYYNEELSNKDKNISVNTIKENLDITCNYLLILLGCLNLEYTDGNIDYDIFLKYRNNILYVFKEYF